MINSDHDIYKNYKEPHNSTQSSFSKKGSKENQKNNLKFIRRDSFKGKFLIQYK